MMIKIKNPFEVNENDTLGTALIKGAAEGYIKGTLAAGVGLGVLALFGAAISKKERNSKKEQDEEITEEEVEEALNA